MFTRKRHHPWRWITVIALVVLIGLLVWLIVRPFPHHQSKPATGPKTTPVKVVPQKETTTPTTSTNAVDTSKTKAPDPSTIHVLTIPQLDISLGYSKTLPGVAYQIARTPAGTQYVELMNDDLVGSKCTDDQGVFASLIKNPSTNDMATITSTVKVGSDTYGLSLPSADCTSDVALFQQYQASMKANFPYLSATTQ